MFEVNLGWLVVTAPLEDVMFCSLFIMVFVIVAIIAWRM